MPPGKVYVMKSQVNTRRLAVVAAAACSLIAISACSGGGSSGASSTTTRTTAATSSAATTTSSPASSSSSVASPATSSTVATPSPTSTKPPADPAAACLTANTKNNAASTQWNTAVTSQSKSKLDAAAHNFEATAKSLRALPAQAGDKGFATRVNAVAADLDAMAKDRFAGKSVSPTTYNSDSEKLRSYCMSLITKK